jgi:hypothetical protein
MIQAVPAASVHVGWSRGAAWCPRAARPAPLPRREHDQGAEDVLFDPAGVL